MVGKMITVSHSRNNIVEKKKRYANLMNWKPEKFHNYTQERHSGSHAIAWAAITTFVCKGNSLDLQFGTWA